MFTRRQRKVPKGGNQSPTKLLLDRARVQLQAAGQVRMPAKPWLDAASLYLSLQRLCRAVGEDETPVIQVSAQTGAFEQGHVFLPKQAPWLADYRKEILSFPKSKHKDQVDSTSQALKWIFDKGEEPGILTYYRNRVREDMEKNMSEGWKRESIGNTVPTEIDATRIP
jgi:hypothetical protein